MALLGRSEDLALAKRFAAALAAELASVGISLDYAPVLDIHSNPRNPVIGDRALSAQPETVAKFGSAIIEELQRAGVAACGKHFPGHGDTAADSHVELPVVEHPPDRIRSVELVPFRAAVEAEVAFIMTAHILAVALDDRHPATLSKRIVTDLLRMELGFRGVIVSDDLEMNAIAGTQRPPTAAVAAIAAGCDAVLMCGAGPDADIGLQVETLEALIHAVEDGTLPGRQVEASLDRNRTVKERFRREWRPPSSAALRAIIGCDEHRAIAEEMSAFA
jgi:beta-N-acetylhexosaminidase